MTERGGSACGLRQRQIVRPLQRTSADFANRSDTSVERSGEHRSLLLRSPEKVVDIVRLRRCGRLLGLATCTTTVEAKFKIYAATSSDRAGMHRQNCASHLVLQQCDRVPNDPTRSEQVPGWWVCAPFSCDEGVGNRHLRRRRHLHFDPAAEQEWTVACSAPAQSRVSRRVLFIVSTRRLRSSLG